MMMGTSFCVCLMYGLVGRCTDGLKDEVAPEKDIMDCSDGLDCGCGACIVVDGSTGSALEFCCRKWTFGWVWM